MPRSLVCDHRIMFYNEYYECQYPPQGRSLKIPRGEERGKDHKSQFKESMKLNWNFLRGGRVKTQKLFMRGVWTFSGRTHLISRLVVLANVSVIALLPQTRNVPLIMLSSGYNVLLPIHFIRRIAPGVPDGAARQKSRSAG